MAGPRINLAWRRAARVWLTAALFGALVPAGASAQCHYDVTVIRAPCGPDGTSPTLAAALNNHGDVVGHIIACPPGPELPFIWTAEGGLEVIEMPPGATRGWAWDINDRREVVGTVDMQGFNGFFLGSDGLIVLPPAGNGGCNQAVAINEDSTVVGTRSITDALNPESAYSWREGMGFVDLGVLSGPETHGEDVAEDGTVLGWLGTGTTTNTGFVADGKQVIMMGPVPGGFTSWPRAISSNGVVVGRGRVPADGFPFGVLRAFKWSEGTFTMLPELDTSVASSARDINRFNIIVGGAGPAVLWIGGAVCDLNQLSDAVSGRYLDLAVGISDQGIIVARGYDSGAVSFLLTPRDRPQADIDGDCEVGRSDLTFLVRDWGSDSPLADVNADGVVDALDLLAVLAGWTEHE